jgi:hypothetical protein
MKNVFLHSGEEHAASLVAVTMKTLRGAFADDAILFYELNEKAKNPNHEMFGATKKKATAMALCDSGGQMHASVREIILNAVEGEGFDLQLKNPVAPQGDATE